jgi:adenylate cyclase
MSRHHTEIMADESKFILTDLGSTNGTFVNGKRVAEAELKDGDTIEIGKVALRFRRL